MSKYLIRGIFFLIISNLILSPFLSANTLPDSVAIKFINAVLNNSSNLKNFVIPKELEISNRLGIEYYGIKNKFMISNDLDSLTKYKIVHKEINYDYRIIKIDDDYSKLFLSVPAEKINLEYLFYKSYLISKPFYYSGNWKREESKYFKFFVSDPDYFNAYSIKKLDAFVENMVKLLGFSEIQKQKLEKEKIYYFLCRDNEEIKILTGYEARGLFYIPYDYIITTYNCHYHEILHLLINYKLKHLSLYTLPFFQEGFAVAYGGRGGKEPNVILNMGNFLEKSNFLDYKNLLSKSDFYKYDASMTYPVSGLYVKFLIESEGINNFIKLYREYSSNSSGIEQLKINLGELPPEEKWEKFMNQYSLNNPLKVSGIREADFQQESADGKEFKIIENENSYLFKLKGTVAVVPAGKLIKYKSRLFGELFPNKKYGGQKYIITADSNEISIYNLYTNNLIAKYVSAFSVSGKAQTDKNGLIIFSVRKSLFDEPLKSDIIHHF